MICDFSEEGGKAKLVVKAGKEAFRVGDELLFDARGVHMESARLIGTPSNPHLLSKIEDGFAVLFEFGEPCDHGDAKNPVKVYKVLKIHFGEKCVEHSDLALPAGNFRNQWSYFDQFPNKEREEAWKVENAVEGRGSGVPERVRK